MSKLADFKALADEWQWQGELARREAVVSSHFDHVGPHDLIRMWESGKNLHGRSLSRFETEALVERWLAVFHDWPPFEEDAGDSTEEPEAPVAPEPELPADDTMLPIREVVRITGVSESTIKRMVNERPPRFPRPLHLSPRRIGWPARDVRLWLEELEGARRKVRS